jgi:hypothetical protein
MHGRRAHKYVRAYPWAMAHLIRPCCVVVLPSDSGRAAGVLRRRDDAVMHTETLGARPPTNRLALGVGRLAPNHPGFQLRLVEFQKKWPQARGKQS